MANVKLYFMGTRPQFLLLTPLCLLISASVAYWQSGTVNILYFIIALLGALSAHASVNLLNDYYDYRSGLDLKVPRTPFSGGSGFLPDKKLTPWEALILGVGTFLFTVLVGIFFIVFQGWGILLAGILGLLLVGLYTQVFVRYPIMCLLAPGLGFGPCMVLGGYFALQGFYDVTALAASIVPGILISNLLLINQFPDAEGDREVGRRHLPILIGKERSARLYAGLLIGTYIWIVFAVLVGLMPLPVLVALLTVPLAVITIQGVFKNFNKLERLIPFLGFNVITILATLFLVSVGFFVS